MAGRVVAILAQVRRMLVQDLVVRGAMRVVAARAVLLDRWVGEHERSALVGVAAQALVVDRCIAQHHGADGAMRIVAIGALDLAFDDRVVRRLQGLRTDVLVARATNFRFVRTEGRLERCDGRVPDLPWMLWQFEHATSFSACLPDSQNASCRFGPWQAKQTAVFSAAVPYLI